jgi:hypothetical protein
MTEVENDWESIIGRFFIFWIRITELPFMIYLFFFYLQYKYKRALHISNPIKYYTYTVLFNLQSVSTCSRSMFFHSTFGHSMFGLSTFHHSTPPPFGHSMFGHSKFDEKKSRFLPEDGWGVSSRSECCSPLGELTRRQWHPWPPRRCEISAVVVDTGKPHKS